MHTKPLFWIYLLDVQRVVLVDIYLLTFFDNKGVSLLTLSGPAFSVVRQARGGSEAQMPKIKVNIDQLK